MNNKKSKIYVAGHRGLVGSAIVKNLKAQGFSNIISRTSEELNLLDQQAVEDFFKDQKPEYIFLAAAKVGGIHANNTCRGEFIYNNLMIQNNIMHQSYLYGAKRLLFLGSSCIFPKLCPQPMKEEYLMTGPLEPTNSPYAVAKIAGIEMCWAYNCQYGTQFIPVMPTNLYGNNDNFDLENSHVLPALIRKFHLAKMALEGNAEAIRKDEQRFGIIPHDVRKSIGVDEEYRIAEDFNPEVIVWGTGTPRREFLHVDDMADACVYIMSSDDQCLRAPCNQSQDLLFNIGTGVDQSIKDLALMAKDAVGFTGDLVFDKAKPDGTPQKLLDVSRLQGLNWKANITLEQGMKKVYKWYLSEAN